MKNGILTLLFLWIPFSLFAQKESANVRDGNKLYKKEKYTEAEVEYRKGLNKNQKSFEGSFNLGDALYRQEKYDEAIEQFKKAETLADSNKKKLAAVHHNIGNSLMQQHKYAESIEAYKSALKNNPKDDDTRYNLAYAQQMLQQQQQQQQQDQQKDEQKQDKKEQEQQNKQEEQPQPQEPQMSKENAEQILNALLQDEKDTQEKAKKMKQKGVKKTDKDW